MRAVLLAVLMLGACTSSPREQPNATPAASSPTFACPTEQVVEPDAGYPHPEQVYPLDRDDPSRPVAALTQFCEQTLAAFAEPNLTRTEADSLYRALETTLVLSDEPYGMPSPDAPATRAVDLRERVLLRKTAPGTFEVFFYRTGCGRTYEHLRVQAGDTGSLRVEEIEKWRKTYPC